MKAITATITTSMPHVFSVGDEVEILCGFVGHGGIVRGKSKIVSVSSNSVTFEAAPLTIWSRFWYYLRNPRLWKYALDIPFTPPDILVQR